MLSKKRNYKKDITMKKNKIEETFQNVTGLNSNTAVLIYKQTRRLVILVVGLSLLLVGVLLIFLPGPAIVVIPLALIILSTEFLWAKHFLTNVKEKFGLIEKDIKKEISGDGKNNSQEIKSKN